MLQRSILVFAVLERQFFIFLLKEYFDTDPKKGFLKTISTVNRKITKSSS